MSPINRKVILPLAAMLVGFACVYFLSNFVSANRVTLPENYQDADLSVQGGRLKGWSLGAEGLLADWYWMWSLQYMGTKILDAKAEELNLDDLSSLDPKLLYPLLDNATDLDPKYMAVYSYGASILPAIDPQKAIALTEKGIDRNPDAWRLYQYLGYIHWRLDDYEKAADVYDRGSRIPGAPQFMRQMTAAMKTRGGSRETARELYKQMMAEAEDQQSRSNAERRLLELDSLDELEAINEILRSHQERIGVCPAALGTLLSELAKISLPGGRKLRVNAKNEVVDPLGYPYTFEAHNCSVRLNLESKIPKS